MLDIVQDILKWETSGKKFALATVVNTWRSAPRGVGASMIIDEDGKMIGSVSGGCVEGQVVKTSREILRTGEGKDLKFGVSNDDAWSVGLSCGGAISVYVQPFFNQSEIGNLIWEELKNCLQKDYGCVLIYANGSLGFISTEKKFGDYPEMVFEEAIKSLKTRQSQLDEIAGTSYFFHVFPPKNRLLIIGAAHISRDLITLALQQNFSIRVIDPRGLFYESLLDLVEEVNLLRKWPAEALPEMKLDESVFVVLLTHDPKIDDQALKILLEHPVSYIGALGSKKTHQRRITRLLEAGVSQEKIDRIHGPVGLSIGANTPAEIALSIMAEIVQVKNLHFPNLNKKE